MPTLEFGHRKKGWWGNYRNGSGLLIIIILATLVYLFPYEIYDYFSISVKNCIGIVIEIAANL